jgi:hypothetical protein
MGTCGSDETVVFSQPPSPIARAVSCLVESKSMGADEWSHFRSVLAFNLLLPCHPESLLCRAVPRQLCALVHTEPRHTRREAKAAELQDRPEPVRPNAARCVGEWDLDPGGSFVYSTSPLTPMSVPFLRSI